MSRLIVQGKLTFFFFFKLRLRVALWEKALWVDTRSLKKSEMKPWPRHSTWKQITFQSHSVGNARNWQIHSGWQATQHRKQDRGALRIPVICQRMPLWLCKSWDEGCLQMHCFYLLKVPEQNNTEQTDTITQSIWKYGSQILLEILLKYFKSILKYFTKKTLLNL